MHPDVIMSIWDDPRNVDTLVKMHGEGKSFSQIAKVIPGATRNAVIGKAKRMKLPPRENRYAESQHTHRRTVNGRDGHRGASGGLGQSKANSIIHRVEGRLKAERARQEGRFANRDAEPFRAGRLPRDDEGVDVTALIAFAARRINHECAWIPGDPLDGAMCCGEPVKDGSQWCEAHHARVYSGRAEL